MGYYERFSFFQNTSSALGATVHFAPITTQTGLVNMIQKTNNRIASIQKHIPYPSKNQSIMLSAGTVAELAKVENELDNLLADIKQWISRLDTADPKVAPNTLNAYKILHLTLTRFEQHTPCVEHEMDTELFQNTAMLKHTIEGLSRDTIPDPVQKLEFLKQAEEKKLTNEQIQLFYSLSANELKDRINAQRGALAGAIQDAKSRIDTINTESPENNAPKLCML